VFVALAFFMRCFVLFFVQYFALFLFRFLTMGRSSKYHIFPILGIFLFGGSGVGVWQAISPQGTSPGDCTQQGTANI